MKKKVHEGQLFVIGLTVFLCIFFLIIKECNVSAISDQKSVKKELEINVVTEKKVKQDKGQYEERKKIAITFDDGPHPVYTKILLDGLLERKVQASFFVTGANAQQYKDLVKRMDKEGHLIGNHTFHHIQLTDSNGTLFYEELKETNQVIYEITGKDTEYVRPPFGSWNKKYEQQLNMIPILWNIDPMDWCSCNRDDIVHHVLERAQDNAIILMHDEYETSVCAALSIIDELKKQGYEFVTVDQIVMN